MYLHLEKHGKTLDASKAIHFRFLFSLRIPFNSHFHWMRVSIDQERFSCTIKTGDIISKQVPTICICGLVKSVKCFLNE